MLSNKRGFAIVLLAFILGVITISNNKTLRNIYYLNIETSLFFWDDNLASKREISGSNKDMRWKQIVYVNSLIDKHLLTGLGYDYPIIHSEKYGTSSDALFFESLYLYVIASSGYIGLFVWILFFIRCIGATKDIFEGKYKNYILHGCYIFSIFLTGISLSFSFYMIILSLMIRYKYISIIQPSRR